MESSGRLKHAHKPSSLTAHIAPRSTNNQAGAILWKQHQFLEPVIRHAPPQHADLLVLAQMDGVDECSPAAQAEILDILDSKAEITEKGIGNMAFANAMASFEASGILDPKIANRLLVDNGVRIVK